MSEPVETVKVSEVFRSVQGEGPAMGRPMTFLRLAHCNIDCVWCDTPQRLTGEKRLIEDLVDDIAAGPIDVCLTGGEPMLQLEKLSLMLEHLMAAGFQMHLETNGTIDPTPHTELLDQFEFVIVSPKLPSAQNPNPKSFLERRPVFDRPAYDAWVKRAEEKQNTVFKFVVGTEDDWAALDALVAELVPTVTVIIQPDTFQPTAYEQFGKEILERVAAGWPGEAGPTIRYMPRFHAMMWGQTPGR